MKQVIRKKFARNSQEIRRKFAGKINGKSNRSCAWRVKRKEMPNSHVESNQT